MIVVHNAERHTHRTIEKKRKELSVRRRWHRIRNNRRGAALVEFAVVIPLFLVFTVGLIEVGRAIMVQQIVTNASREGARIASYNSTSSSTTVSSAISSIMSSANISGATTSVSPSVLSTVPEGDPVSVTITVSYSQVSWVPSPFFLGGRNIQATSVMRREPALQ